MLIDAWFPFVGGGQIHVQKLSQALEEKYSCQIKIFYTQNISLGSRLLWTFLVVPQVIIYSLSNQVDIIHSHAFLPGISSKLISLILNKPCVHTVHGSHLMDQKTKGPKAILEKFILTQIKYTKQITVSSTFLKYQNTNKNIEVIRNGVDLKSFDSVEVKKTTYPTILWIGRNHTDKGLKYMVKAYQKLKKTFKNLKLDAIVDGNLDHSQLIKVYKRSHIFVSSSLAEGQPITLLEAWAAKLPAVITRVGDNPNMVTNDKSGILIEPKNSQDIIKAVSKLLKNPTLSKKLANNGYQEVKKHYTWDQVASQTYKLYQSLSK